MSSTHKVKLADKKKFDRDGQRKDGHKQDDNIQSKKDGQGPHSTVRANENYPNKNQSYLVDMHKKSHNDSSSGRHSTISHEDPLIDIWDQNPSQRRSTSPPPLKLQSNILWEKELEKLPAVPAVEVIVANLPSGIYQAELYDLCKSGEPLHIRTNCTPDKYRIHFAHVFVKNSKLAEILIEDINGKLLNKNIIVAALPETILERFDTKQNQKYH